MKKDAGTMPTSRASALPVLRFQSSVLSSLSFISALCVTFIAFMTRVWSLGDASLWFDEGLSVKFASRDLPALMETMIREDLHPPLYYLFLHGWMQLAGQREFAVRFVSLIPGLLLVPLAYATAKEVYYRQRRASLVGLAVGVPAAALVALSPFLIYYSQEARMYGLVAYLALLTIYTLLRATRTDVRSFGPHRLEVLANEPTAKRPPMRTKDEESVRVAGVRSLPVGQLAARPPAPISIGGSIRMAMPWLAHSLALAAMLYTQYLALFLLPALFLYAAISGWRALRAWLLSATLTALLYAPWVNPAIDQINRLINNPDFFPAELNLGTVAGRIMQSFLGIESSRLAGLVIGLGVGVGFILLLQRWLRQRDLARREALPILAALLPILLTSVAVTIMPKFAERYAIVAAPALYIALTLSLFTVLWRGVGRWVYLTLVVGALLWSVPQAWSATHAPWAPQEDARRMAAYLTERATEKHAILLMDDAPYAFEYYYRGAAPYVGLRVGMAFDHGANVVNQILATQPDRIWLVQWHHEFADPSGMVMAELERRSLEEPTVRTNFVGYKLVSYRLQDYTPIVANPPPQQPINVEFGGRLKLVGGDRLADREGLLRWILYWQATTDLDRDYSVALQLRDAQGTVRLTHNQPPSTSYLATAGFPVGVTLRGLTQVRLPADLPLGVYDAFILVWDPREQANLAAVGANGPVSGNAIALGRVEITPELLKKQ